MVETESAASRSPTSTVPSSPEQAAPPTMPATAADEDEPKGFVVVGPSSLSLHDDVHFSYRESDWALDLKSTDIGTVAEIELRPSGGQHQPADHNAVDWALLLTPDDDGGGGDSGRIVIPLPLVAPVERSAPLADATHGAKQFLVDQALSLAGRRIPKAEPPAEQPRNSSLHRQLIWAEHGAAVGVRYLASLQVGGMQVGSGAAASKDLCLTDLSARTVDTDDALVGCGELLRVLETEASQGQHWAEWLGGSEHRSVACADVWPTAVLNEATVATALRAARVHTNCFLDVGLGVSIVEEGGELYLQLPVAADGVAALRDRLVSTVRAAAAPPARGGAMSKLSAKISTKAAFFVVCICLGWYQSSAAPLLLAACVHSACYLLNDMATCERKWVKLEQQFAAWSQHQQHASLTSPELQQLLSRDGPWRGQYEECLSSTRAQAGRSSSQAAALALLLSAGWLVAELFYSPDTVPVEPELLLSAAVASGAVVAVLWMAAGLTARVQDQSGHLYEIHRLAVEVLARELAAESGCGRAAVLNAKVEFEMEYGLVKEFMSLNGAIDGCTILECRVTRSHALTATTMLLPALAKELQPEAAVLLCTPVWLCICVVTCATAFSAMATDAQLWLSPTWVTVTNVQELLAASRRVVIASCKQGTLGVVMFAVILRAVQLHRATVAADARWATKREPWP